MRSGGPARHRRTVEVTPDGAAGGRSLQVQTMALAVALGGSQVAVAAAYLVAARGAGPDAFGSVVTVISVGLVAAALGDFGANSLLTRDGARGVMAPQELRDRTVTKIAVAGAAAVVAAAVLLVLPGVGHRWLAAVPVAFALLASQAAMVPLRARARGVAVAGFTLFDRTVALVLVLAVAAAGGSAAKWLWAALTIGSLLSTALAWRLNRTLDGRLAPVQATNPWRGSAHYGTTASFVAVQGLDVAVVNLAGGAVAAGVYGAVNRWTAPMGLLSTAFTQAAVPFVAREASGVAALRRLRRSAWVLGVAVLLCLVIAVAAGPLVSVLMGPAFADSRPVLVLLALGTAPAVLNQPLAMFLQARGLDRFVAWALGTTVAVQLVLAAVLSTAHGAIGAATAFLVAQVALLLVMAAGLRLFGVLR